jgi:hypothetical protein
MDDLQRAVKSGNVRPGDQLFDAGTGLWAPAWKVPVYRFIVEELELDDELPPGLKEEMEAEGTDPPPTTGPVVDQDEVLASGGSGSEDDPFDLSFELVDTDALTPEEAPPREPPGEIEERGFKRDEGAAAADAKEDEDAIRGDDRGIQAGSPEESDPDEFRLQLGSGFNDSWGEEWGDVGEAPAPSSKSQDTGSRSAKAKGDLGRVQDADTGWSTPGEEGGSATGKGPPGVAEPEDEPARWTPDSPEDLSRTGRGAPRGPGRTRGMLPLLLLIAVGVVGVGWFAFYSSGNGTGSPTQAEAPPVVPRPDVPPPPDGLQEQLPPALSGIAARFEAVTDSLRTELVLGDAPPRIWLSGFYLANAGQLPSVSQFWERYGEFLELLEARDRAIYMEGVEQGLQDEDMGPEDRDRMLAYMEERYTILASYRAHRYESLSQAADAAVQLHQVLARHEGVINHAPVEGSGVSTDPILEADIPGGSVQREVERSLDRVFLALDRSRGGGVPSADGLRTDLFLRFGEG